MTAATRSLATALWGARFASGLLPLSYTTRRDTTSHTSHFQPHRTLVSCWPRRPSKAKPCRMVRGQLRRLRGGQETPPRDRQRHPAPAQGLEVFAVTRALERAAKTSEPIFREKRANGRTRPYPTFSASHILISD